MNRKKIIANIAALLLPILVFAQDAAKPAEKTVESGNNLLAILLSVVAILLTLVIWGMGRALVEVSRMVLEKNKKVAGAAANLPLVALLCATAFFIPSANAQDAVPSVIKTVPNYGGLSENTFYAFVTVIGMEIIAILVLAFFIKRMYAELVPEKIKRPAKRSALAIWWSGLDKKLFTRAVPVEKEADVLLDHNYDGIRELDNALPPWWKYGFYITIVVAFVYMLHFHVLGSGKNPTEEYQAEMEKAQVDKEIYDAQNKDKIDEQHVPMADAAGIKMGQEMFEANCVTCHMKGAGGSQVPVSVGPNLTDDYWLHKGSLNDIFQSITHGYPDKGMQAWSVKFNPKEISLLASYIRSVRGTNPPNARLPQGDMYAEEVKTDSTGGTKKDSAVLQQIPVVKTDTTHRK